MDGADAATIGSQRTGVGFDIQNIGDAMVAIVGGLVKSGSSPTVRDIMIQ